MNFRIRFYSDDSYSSCGKKRVHAVIAGVAVQADRMNVHAQLLEAERISGKRLSDWNHTHPTSCRERYLEAVFGIQALRERIFFRAFDELTHEGRWIARVDTLEAAIRVYTPGNCHHEMHPEGQPAANRERLRKELKAKGCLGVTVVPGGFEAAPEVRLADAIAGYVRGELYRGNGQRAALTNLPDWFVNLERP